MPPHNNDDLTFTNDTGYTSYSERNENETSHSFRPLVPGVYAPTSTFFDVQTEELDLPTIRRHTVRLAKGGLAGLVTQGSNGEAVHLSHAERRTVTEVTREALDEAGYTSLPIIVGCGAQSTRETIELCNDAKRSGGDYAMVLPPSYFRTLYTTQSQLEFFTDVADKSPVPILIYNYPGAVSGIDLNSDEISTLAKHPNIVGVKLTCGNTGKLGRIASVAPNGFLTLGGSSDFTLQTLVVGGKGIIGGLANIAPRACTDVFKLYMAGKTELAEKMQAVVARGDWVTIKGGVVSTKSILQSHFGYGGYGRKPLPRPTKEQDVAIKEESEELVLLEEFLEKGMESVAIHSSKTKQFPQLVELERLLAA